MVQLEYLSNNIYNNYLMEYLIGIANKNNIFGSS